MTDHIESYLAAQRYADHVVTGGVRGLVESWEYTVDGIIRGETMIEPEYLNDMDGRRILAEVLAILPPEERRDWDVRVHLADARVRPFLVPTVNCLWGQANEQRHGYVREQDWWYYHRPLIVDPDWSWGDD